MSHVVQEIDVQRNNLIGIVVAGGQGTRMGFQKQYALLGGSPMWVWSVRALFACEVERVFVVVPREGMQRVADVAKAEAWGHRCAVVAGGQSRADSVQNGLHEAMKWVGSDGPNGESSKAEWIVLVHDAARPFVGQDDVNRLIGKVQETGAAILASACRDTVKRANCDGIIAQTLVRDELWLAQTPQGFRLSLLWESYQKWTGLSVPTDDACVVEAAGHVVYVVSATGVNLKITTPADLQYAEWYAERVQQELDG